MGIGSFFSKKIGNGVKQNDNQDDKQNHTEINEEIADRVEKKMTKECSQEIENKDNIENFPTQLDASKYEDIALDEEMESTTQEEKIENKEEVENKKEGFFQRLKLGLKKTSESFSGKLDDIFTKNVQIDKQLYEELEEILITSDISFNTTIKIIENLRNNINKKKIKEVSLVKEELKNVLYELLGDDNSQIDLSENTVILVVGVNGVGKTTTIGKLASKFKSQGKKVILAAADTFRAAATQQLEIWANRADVDIVKMHEGADPSAVIYDAIQKTKKEKADVLICDTAGRLHNKKNLMNELSKIQRVITKEYQEAKIEVLIVLDATTGQNALNQVKAFGEILDITGIIMTKLDGTAKGGVLFSVKDEYNIPIKYIGVGEKTEDLQAFDGKSFVDAII